MSHLLYIDVSPMGEHSVSRSIADAFVGAYTASHKDAAVIKRDLSVDPIPHLDGETIMAGYIPAEQRTPSQVAKQAFRMELVEEVKTSTQILIATPMWNWQVPSVLKAWIDQIIIPGVLDASSESATINPRVTVVVAQGGSYAEGAPRHGWDYLTGYIKQVFGSMGVKDIEVILAEFTLAGVAPGMETFVENKKASIAAAIEKAQKRAS
jgi:FMN-dependent NADH-azoreductase